MKPEKLEDQDREQEQEPTPETKIGGDKPKPELEERPPGTK